MESFKYVSSETEVGDTKLDIEIKYMSLTAVVYMNSEGALLLEYINSEVIVLRGDISGENSVENSVNSLVYGVLADRSMVVAE